MKVTLAFLPNLWRVPQICVSCGQSNQYLQQVPIKTIEFTDWSGKRWRNWTFNFPYCTDCLSKAKKGTNLISALKREHAPVEAPFVQSKKYGKMLRKKEAKYVEFTFTNDSYAQLFKEANKDLLFDKFFKNLQASEKL